MAFSRKYEDSESQRVNKWLASLGVCSRREAEALIAEGAVFIDGEQVADVGRKILPGQVLTLAEAGEATLASAVSIVLHKPVGVVSGQPEPGEVPAVRLLTRQARYGDDPVPRRDASLPPLGRLDKDSRGLLILSDDGVLARALIGPGSAIDKEYLVFVKGEITEDRLALLRHGLELDGRKLRPARVEVVADRRLRFILNEGRNRQIRRMCQLVDLKVVDLFRTRVGPVTLGDMPEGRWRHLTPAERQALLTAARPQDQKTV